MSSHKRLRVSGTPVEERSGSALVPFNSAHKNKIGFMPKLVSMLATTDPRVLAWSDSGVSFFVYNVERFSLEVLVHYLRSNNFASFVRQLNYYGFHKTTHVGNDGVMFYEFRHDSFLRDCPERAEGIQRRTATDTGLIDHDAVREENDRLKARLAELQQKLDGYAAERDALLEQRNADAGVIANLRRLVTERSDSSSLRSGDAMSTERSLKRERPWDSPVMSPLAAAAGELDGSSDSDFEFDVDAPLLAEMEAFDTLLQDATGDLGTTESASPLAVFG